MITISSDQENVKPKHYKADRSDPKHIRNEKEQPKHLKAKKSKAGILRAVVAVELISVILACSYIYRIWCHNIEMQIFGQVCSASLLSASDCMDDHTHKITKTYMESVAEELYEYVWTTKKIKYRTGADTSYKSKGTLEKDKMIRRTGITHNGWSRIDVDGKEYYVPKGTLSGDIPDSLPIADGIKGEYQKYALSLLPDFGWDSSELEPLIYLWNCRAPRWLPKEATITPIRSRRSDGGSNI